VAGFGRFLLRRLLGIIVLVWATTVAAFVLLRVGPPSAGMDAQISQQLGAGQPASWQYAHYLLRLLHGNLGVSLSEGVSVDTIVRNALPPTLSLMVGGTVLWLTAGVVAGTVSALRPGSAADRIATGGVLTGLAVPTFLLALLLLIRVFLRYGRQFARMARQVRCRECADRFVLERVWLVRLTG